jgi:hypothetical protein
MQRHAIDGYAQMHGRKVAKLFAEEGVSGSVPTAERPVGGPLFARLRKGDIIIAPKLDRLFRSALDTLQVVEVLRKRGVSLHLLDLGGDHCPLFHGRGDDACREKITSEPPARWCGHKRRSASSSKSVSSLATPSCRKSSSPMHRPDPPPKPFSLKLEEGKDAFAGRPLASTRMTPPNSLRACESATTASTHRERAVTKTSTALNCP